MPSRIMWLSQHAPTPRQRSELERIYPEHTLIIDHSAFDDVEDILKRYRAAKADQMVLVAPLTVIRTLTRKGVHPIYAEMRSVSPNSEHAEVKIGKRAYQFVAFHRVDEVTLKLTKLEEEK